MIVCDIIIINYYIAGVAKLRLASHRIRYKKLFYVIILFRILHILLHLISHLIYDSHNIYVLYFNITFFSSWLFHIS